jgi:hypothetical protein
MRTTDVTLSSDLFIYKIEINVPSVGNKVRVSKQHVLKTEQH